MRDVAANCRNQPFTGQIRRILGKHPCHTERVPVEAELVGRRPAFREDDVRFAHLQQAIEINRGDGFRELRRI